MSEIIINEQGVKTLLDRLKPLKATGPDNISARFLREFASEIAPAHSLIYQLSLQQGSLPKDWLHANVVPVYKGGNKDKNLPEEFP